MAVIAAQGYRSAGADGIGVEQHQVSPPPFRHPAPVSDAVQPGGAVGEQRDIAVLTSRLRETSDQLRQESLTFDRAKTQLEDLTREVDRLKTEVSVCTAPAPPKPVPRWATSYAR